MKEKSSAHQGFSSRDPPWAEQQEGVSEEVVPSQQLEEGVTLSQHAEVRGSQPLIGGRKPA